METDFTAWRRSFLLRDTSDEQAVLAADLDHARRQSRPMIWLRGEPGIGQTTLICDWVRWAVRSDPGFRVHLVATWAGGLYSFGRLTEGLLPTEKARLTLGRQIELPTPEVLTIVDDIRVPSPAV